MREVVCPGCGSLSSEFDIACTSCGRTITVMEETWLDGDSNKRSNQKTGNTLRLEPGTPLGHFEVIEKIGEGGMGAIFKARDLRLDRIVALKVFRSPLPNSAKAAEILLREAKTASALNHPHIVTIYEVFREGDSECIAMEWLNGQTLEQLIGPHGMAPELFLDYAGQMIEGLWAAHQKGIIHRDIKPSNVMVNPQGKLKILDFGLARYSQEDAPSGVSGTGIKGTIHYMSPEQCRGDGVDIRSDIFSFGVLLYEMATGQRPFRGQGMGRLIDAINQEKPQPPSVLRAGLNPGLDLLILGCLEKDSDRRFAHMGILKERLMALKNPVEAPLNSAGQIEVSEAGLVQGHPYKWKKQTLGIVLAMAVVALVLIGFFRPFQPDQRAGIVDLATDKIAVLPFENISGDPLLQVFSDGLTANLTSQLTRLNRYRPNLWVVPVSEVRRLRPISVEQVYQRFGVDLVISGNIQFLGELRRVNVNIVQAGPTRQVYSQSIDLHEDRLFPMQGQIVSKVLDLLQWELTAQAKESLQKIDTTLSGAYRHYLQGSGYLYRYGEKGNLDLAMVEFEKALQLDPTYIPPRLALSEAYRLQWRSKKDPRWLDRALDNTLLLSESRGELAGVSLSLAHIYFQKGQYAKAIEAYAETLTLEPDQPAAHYGLAAVYTEMGRWQQAEEMYQKTLKRFPNDWTGTHKLALFYYKQGKYSQAEDLFRDLIQATPNNVICYRNLAACLYYQGREEEALDTYGKALQMSPTSSLYSNVGGILFTRERFAEAAQAFQKAIELKSNYHVYWGNLGDAYRWGPGDRSRAVPAYGRAIELASEQLEVNPGNTQMRLSLATYLAKLGMASEAIEEMEKVDLEKANPGQRYLMAVIWEITGAREQALALLNQALDLGYSVYDVCMDPELENLRADRRFTY